MARSKSTHAGQGRRADAEDQGQAEPSFGGPASQCSAGEPPQRGSEREEEGAVHLGTAASNATPWSGQPGMGTRIRCPDDETGR